MNVSEIQFDVETIKWSIVTVLGVVTFLTNRQMARATELEALKTRTGVLEERISHLPDQTDIMSLSNNIHSMQADIAAMREVNAALLRNLERINSFLMENPIPSNGK